MRRYRGKVRLFDRREVLRVGGLSIAGSALLACDKLDLPSTVILREVIEPITPTEEFYTYSHGPMPGVDLTTLSMTVRDRGDPVLTITPAALAGLTLREKEHTLQCIGSGPRLPQISNAIWGGLPLREVFSELGIPQMNDALEIKFLCADGYDMSIPAGDMDKPIWLVWEMNGEPLSPEHGAPARLLVPGRYGTQNPKWIVDIDFIDEEWVEFWESRGWDDASVYRPNTFILSPPNMVTLGPGVLQVVGTAFAGSDSIASVEISTDHGRTWQEAEVTYANGPDIWTLWRHEWDLSRPGSYSIQVRATTESGAMTHPDSDRPSRPAGYDGSMEIEIEVS